MCRITPAGRVKTVGEDHLGIILYLTVLLLPLFKQELNTQLRFGSHVANHLRLFLGVRILLYSGSLGSSPTQGIARVRKS